MPLRITPRPVKKLRAAPTPKCESIAIVKAIQAAVRPLNRRNGATGMNAPTAVDTPVSHPSLNGVAWASPIFSATWPAFDERLAAAGDVEVVVQVNGKVRGRVTVSRGASEAEVVARAMQDESVRKFLDGKPVRKTVYVQDRLLNFVV